MCSVKKELQPDLNKGIACSICEDGTLEVLNLQSDAILMVVCPSCGTVGHSCRQAHALFIEGKLPVLPVTPFLGVQFSSQLFEGLLKHNDLNPDKDLIGPS